MYLTLLVSATCYCICGMPFITVNKLDAWCWSQLDKARSTTLLPTVSPYYPLAHRGHSSEPSYY